MENDSCGVDWESAVSMGSVPGSSHLVPMCVCRDFTKDSYRESRTPSVKILQDNYQGFEVHVFLLIFIVINLLFWVHVHRRYVY